jgi:hypothetical protein
MKKYFISLMASFLFLPLFSQQPIYNFARSFGSPTIEYGNSVCTDQQGNIFVTGGFNGTMDIDPGSGVYMVNATSTTTSCYILKLNSQGNFVWAGCFGSIGNNPVIGYNIKTDLAGNIYLMGTISGTVDVDIGPGTYTIGSINATENFICKYTNSGNLIWAKHFGGGSSIVGLDFDPSGNIYIGSRFSGTVDVDPDSGTYTLASNGSYDIFVLKLSNTANFIWAKQLGGTSGESVWDLVYSNLSGDLLISGNFQSSVDFDPGPGTFTFTSNGITDGYICRLSNSGNFIWAAQFGSSGYDGVTEMAIDGADNIYFTGSFSFIVDFDPSVATYTLASNSGAGDSYVAKLSPGSGLIFVRQIKSTVTGTLQGYNLSLDSFGSIYTSGYFTSTADFDPGPSNYPLSPLGTNDSYLLKLDALGNFNWALQFGWQGYTTTRSMVLDGSGNIYGTGDYRGVCDFDPGAGSQLLSSVTPTANDVFVFKFSTCQDAPVNTSAYYTCSGASATLSASSNASLINWYSSQTSTTSLGAGSVFVSPALSPGNYTFYAAASTCTSSMARTPVYINIVALPNVSLSANPSTICSGNSATLNAIGANSYTWQNSVQAASITVSPSVTMVYSINGKDSLSSCINTASINLQVNALPLIQISTPQTTVCSGSKLILNASGADTYSWSTGALSSSVVLIPTVTTVYSITGTFTSTTCMSNKTISISVLPCTSIYDLDRENNFYEIYPNPGKGDFYISTALKNFEINIYNSLGQLCYKSFSEESKSKIDLEHLKAGLYLVEISTDSHKKMIKLIIAH